MMKFTEERLREIEDFEAALAPTTDGITPTHDNIELVIDLYIAHYTEQRRSPRLDGPTHICYLCSLAMQGDYLDCRKCIWAIEHALRQGNFNQHYAANTDYPDEQEYCLQWLQTRGVRFTDLSIHNSDKILKQLASSRVTMLRRWRDWLEPDGDLYCGECYQPTTVQRESYVELDEARGSREYRRFVDYTKSCCTRDDITQIYLNQLCTIPADREDLELATGH